MEGGLGSRRGIELLTGPRRKQVSFAGEASFPENVKRVIIRYQATDTTLKMV